MEDTSSRELDAREVNRARQNIGRPGKFTARCFLHNATMVQPVRPWCGRAGQFRLRRVGDKRSETCTDDPSLFVGTLPLEAFPKRGDGKH